MNIKACLKSHIKFCILFSCVLFFFSACTRSHTSSLKLYLETSSSSSAAQMLKAVNKTARSAVIENPGKAPFMFFSFADTPLSEKNGVQSLISSGGYALELEIETLAPWAGETERNTEKEGFFFLGFVHEKDVVSEPTRSLAKDTQSIEKKTGIKAFVPQALRFTVSLGFESFENSAPSDIRGFMLYSDLPLAIRAARITKARYGWSKSEGRLWFGFSAAGGTIDKPLLKDFSAAVSPNMDMRHTGVPQKIFFLSLPSLGVNESRELHLIFRPEASGMKNTDTQNTVELLCGSEKLGIRRHSSVQSSVIDMRAFMHSFDTVEIISGESMIEGIVIKQQKLSAVSPISADVGLIVDWPYKNRRNDRFELFSWQRFPSVLIFDFADYAVQNAFFKRLAFYVEKKGYAGKLLTDQMMQDMHAFNAHDYRAESLAAFFNQAEKENFRLNEDELILRDILFANKVIIRHAGNIQAGKGAVISISRESPRYLRRLFITHEGLHGIYFTEQSFRTFVDSVFYELEKQSPQAPAFLRRYFEVTPSLNYNTADDYLLKNEFMAYILQQNPAGVKHYFTEVLAKRNFINVAEPELCEYIRKTEAAAFVQAAEIMSAFLYDAWGIEGGNLFSVKLN